MFWTDNHVAKRARKACVSSWKYQLHLSSGVGKASGSTQASAEAVRCCVRVM